MANTPTPIGGKYENKDIVSLDQFSSKDINILFKKVGLMKRIANKAKKSEILKGNIVALIFYEPSTRTFSSFSAAIKRLGGETIDLRDLERVSSVAKGESLKDTVRTLEAYCDALVIRHPEKGTAELTSEYIEIPVINAGDGTGEHPTQALLDLYTINEQRGALGGLTGLMVGDMLNGRTLHSLIRGLSKFKNNTVYLLSPKELRLSVSDREDFQKRGIRLIEIFSENEIPRNAHFWYWTRVQKERFKNLNTYNRVKNRFILNPDLIDKYAGKKTIFMHPLPRVLEIAEEVDKDPRAMYFRHQLKNGMYVRMALLGLVLGRLK